MTNMGKKRKISHDPITQRINQQVCFCPIFQWNQIIYTVWARCLNVCSKSKYWQILTLTKERNAAECAVPLTPYNLTPLDWTSSSYPDLLLTHPQFFKVLTLLDAINLPLQTFPPGFQRHHTLSLPLILSLPLPPVLTGHLIKWGQCLSSLLPLQLHVALVNLSRLVTSTILLCSSLPNAHLQSQSQAWPLVPTACGTNLPWHSHGQIKLNLSKIILSYSFN